MSVDTQLQQAKRQKCWSDDEVVQVMGRLQGQGERAFVDIPGRMIQDPDFWWAFLEIKDDMPLIPQVFERLNHYRPGPVLNNKELMLQLISYSAIVYAAIPDNSPLKTDFDVVQATLTQSPWRFRDVPEQFQERHPGLMGEAFARMPLGFKVARDLVVNDIAWSMWNHREFVRGWMRGGGDYYSHRIPYIHFQEDDEIAQHVAKHSFVVIPEVTDWTLIGDRRSNKSFMIDFAENNPWNFRYIDRDLMNDYDLWVAALSGKWGLAFGVPVHLMRSPEYSNLRVPNGEWLYERAFFRAANYVRNKLQMHHAFVKLVLGSVRDKKEGPSVLATLDFGVETFSPFMKKIAEYAGIPMGKEIGRLRRARENLAKRGYRWADSKI